MRPLHEDDVQVLTEVLNTHGAAVAQHLSCLPAEKQDAFTKPYLQTFFAVNSLLGTTLLKPEIEGWDLEQGTTPGMHTKGAEHKAEQELSRALGAQFQFIKNPRHNIPAESRLALLESLKTVAETLDDLGVFVTQGVGTWSKTNLPEEVGKRASNVREGDTVSKKDALRRTEGLQPSGYGLFKSINMEIERLSDGRGRT